MDHDRHVEQTRLYLNRREVHDWIRWGWLDPSLVGESVIVTSTIPKPSNHDTGWAIDLNYPITPTMFDRIMGRRGPASGGALISMGDLNVQERHDGEVRRGLARCLEGRARRALQLLRERRGPGDLPAPPLRLSEDSVRPLLGGDHPPVQWRIKTHPIESDHGRGR